MSAKIQLAGAVVAIDDALAWTGRPRSADVSDREVRDLVAFLNRHYGRDWLEPFGVYVEHNRANAAARAVVLELRGELLKETSRPLPPRVY